MKIISNSYWKEIQDLINNLEKQIKTWEDIDLENTKLSICYKSKIRDMQLTIDSLTNKDHKHCNFCNSCDHRKVIGSMSYCDLDSMCKDFKDKNKESDNNEQL